MVNISSFNNNYNMLRQILFVFVLSFFHTYCFSLEKIIEGNSYFSNGKIKSFIMYPKTFDMHTKRDIQKWKETVKSEIVYQYEVQGFFNVSVGVNVSRDSSKKTVRWTTAIIIVEGNQFTFGNVFLQTTDTSTPLINAQNLRTQAGGKFNTDDPNRDKRDIEKKYGDLGFAKRRIKLTYFFNDSLKTVDVTFSIDPSHVILFDTLLIENRKERKSTFQSGISKVNFIRGILKINKGDTVKLNRTNSFKTKLKSTRVFNYVRIKDSLLSNKNNKSALHLTLEEKIPGNISTGLFYETNDGFGGEAGWGHRNILGRFYNGKTNVKLAQRRQRIYAGFGNPLLFGYRLRWDNELDFIWRQNQGPNVSTFDAVFSSSLSRPFTKWLRFSSTLEFANTTEKNTTELIGEIPMIIKTRVTNLNTIFSLTFSFLDNEYNPKKGSRFVLIYGNGGPLLDKDNKIRLTQIRHNWLEIKSSYFFPFTSNYIGALRLDGGAFSHNGRSNSRRFFLGGRNSLRNKDFKEVCPDESEFSDTDTSTYFACDPNVTPVYFLTSLELRMKIFKHIRFRKDSRFKIINQLQIVPFSDYGRIWDRGKTQKPEGVGFDIGLGIRIPIIIFNFRFDYAIGWNKGPDWKKRKFLIDLAQAF